MASTYVNDLRLNELATGDASGTWGTITNTNLELIAEAFSFGTEGITTNADTHTSTIADGATDPVRSMYVKYTGTLDSACTITIAPNTVSKLWFIENGTSGSQNIIISQGTGANVTIPAGDTKVVYSDGAGSGAAVVDAFASLSTVDLKVQDDLTVTDDASVGGDLLVSGEVQTANIGFTDGDNAITIADGGGITAANGITSTAAANTFGATSFNDANITNVGDIALDSLSADDSSISIASPVVINGSTPTLTIGDAGEEDTKIVFDGNAQDYYIGLDDSADDLIIGKGSTVGTTPAVVIDENLNVGIGTTSPARPLHIENAEGRLVRLSHTSNPKIEFVDTTNGTSGAYLGSEDNELTFETSGQNERMRIDSAGNVDIKSSNLYLTGSNDRRIKLSDSGIAGVSDSNNTVHIRGDNDSLKLNAAGNGTVVFEIDGSEAMRIGSDGKVLINTTSTVGTSTALVEFNNLGSGGRILNTKDNGTGSCNAITFNNNNGQVGRITTDGSGTSYVTSSDYRMKENLVYEWEAISKIKNLKPVQFNFKTNPDELTEGFIAHEAQSIVPYAIVGEKDGEEMQGMDYGKLTAVLTKAIQEQQELIDSLTTRIETLEATE